MTNNKKPEHIYFPQPINVIQSVPTKYELHWHHFTEMIFYPLDAAPAKTNPLVIVDQVVYEMKPGDTLLIWSSEMHSVESNGENALVGIQFASSLLTDLPEFASYSHLFRNYHLIRHDDPEMEFLSEYMHEKLRQIVAVRKSDAPFHGVEELICVYELFMQFGIQLKDSILPKDLTRQGSNRTFDKINAACRYIAENCDKDLTLDGIANHVGFSSCYFSRVFKQTIQCNFVEYLTLQRLKRAQNLLADSDAAITTIAMESGFKSISTFNRVFQKYKGCSPSEFKKHFLQ